MVSAKHYETQPLKIIFDQVSKLAALQDPDYTCHMPDALDEMVFEARDYDDTETDLSDEHLVLRIKDTDHLLTEWSRAQLLSHMGTREKWFRPVSCAQQAFELNARRTTFRGHRLRIMRSYMKGISVLRGIVSTRYAEIPDVPILEALMAAQPQGEYIPSLSGVTDKAFYCYVVADAKVGTSTFQAVPGAVLRNSEVGFTSLWVTPFLLINGLPVIVRSSSLLRRVHRGSAVELREAFTVALQKLDSVWGPLHTRLEALPKTPFIDEDAALRQMQHLLATLRAAKSVIASCVSAYKAAQHKKHTAATVFDAVLRATAGAGRDNAYERGELAGLFLHRII